MKKSEGRYHHGNLAESLLDAVDELASKFGLEAVTLRACAKLVGVSPSSAFRHYADKRALLTAFAARAIHLLCDSLEEASTQAETNQGDVFLEVSKAYILFALNRPAFFRAMWREEAIYSSDEQYMQASDRLSSKLKSGFANAISDTDPNALSTEELLAWSAVHGLANLFIDGPIGKGESVAQRMHTAEQFILALKPAFQHH